LCGQTPPTRMQMLTPPRGGGGGHTPKNAARKHCTFPSVLVLLKIVCPMLLQGGYSATPTPPADAVACAPPPPCNADGAGWNICTVIAASLTATRPWVLTLDKSKDTFKWYELLVLATSDPDRVAVNGLLLVCKPVSSGNGRKRSGPPASASITRGMLCAPENSVECGPPTHPNRTLLPLGSVKLCEAMKSAE
jgi:hypothetical protein